MANIMAKGADPDYQHFLRFPQYFHMARHSGISGKSCKGKYCPAIFIFRMTQESGLCPKASLAFPNWPSRV